MLRSAHGRPSWPVAVLLATGSGLLYCAGQPGWGAWPLAGVCLVPLVLALWRRPALQRAGIGWIMGSVGAGATVGPTLYACAQLFFEFDTPGSVGLAALVGQLYGALPVALFAVLCGDPARQSAALGAARIGAAWVACEGIRTVAWGGLPWAFLAHALTPVPVLLQAATLGGAFAVSFWLAALNGGIALACIGARRTGALAVAALLLGAVAAHAALSGGPAPAPELSIRLVQGNLPEAWRGDVSRARAALGRLVALTREGGPVDLAVWPENAVSFLLPLNALPLESSLAGLEAVAPYVLLGAPRLADGAAGPHNSAVLVRPGVGIVDHHDKVRLVPFAEYVPPVAAWLGYRGPRQVPGARPRALRVGDTPLGALVCYEIIFPGIARALVRDGAELLVNISNDYWLGGPVGGEQHFAAAVLRAVELGRPVVRATNTGVTGAIDARGRVVGRLAPGEEGALTVAVGRARALTPYARFGDVFAWLAVLFALAANARDLREHVEGRRGGRC